MFTGIIETIGVIKQLTVHPQGGAEVSMSVNKDLSLQTGDSLAINGCCLSLVKQDKDLLYFDISRETLELTHFDSQLPGTRVNLERPVKLNGCLGGHIVTGHIDGLGQVNALEKNSSDWRLWISLHKPELSKYCVKKGSIAINGVSLTINAIEDRPDACALRFDLIPETLQRTNLADFSIGDTVNIEVDILAKHLEKLTKFSKST